MSKQITRFFASRWGIVSSGTVIGIIGTPLQKTRNPLNMSVCVACFEWDISGLKHMGG